MCIAYCIYVRGELFLVLLFRNFHPFMWKISPPGKGNQILTKALDSEFLFSLSAVGALVHGQSSQFLPCLSYKWNLYHNIILLPMQTRFCNRINQTMLLKKLDSNNYIKIYSKLFSIQFSQARTQQDLSNDKWWPNNKNVAHAIIH